MNPVIWKLKDKLLAGKAAVLNMLLQMEYVSAGLVLCVSDITMSTTQFPTLSLVIATGGGHLSGAGGARLQLQRQGLPDLWHHRCAGSLFRQCGVTAVPHPCDPCEVYAFMCLLISAAEAGLAASYAHVSCIMSQRQAGELLGA